MFQCTAGFVVGSELMLFRSMHCCHREAKSENQNGNTNQLGGFFKFHVLESLWIWSIFWIWKSNQTSSSFFVGYLGLYKGQEDSMLRNLFPVAILGMFLYPWAPVCSPLLWELFPLNHSIKIYTVLLYHLHRVEGPLFSSQNLYLE